MDRSLLREPSESLHGMKLIGWGAGQDFTTHFPRHGFDLAYTIDIYPENFGRRIHGIEVRGPWALHGEDPRTCLILVYSTAWFEVLRQVRPLGPFRAVRAHGAPGIRAAVERAIGLARLSVGACRPPQGHARDRRPGPAARADHRNGPALLCGQRVRCRGHPEHLGRRGS